jgi:hypothetical protein
MSIRAIRSLVPTGSAKHPVQYLSILNRPSKYTLSHCTLGVRSCIVCGCSSPFRFFDPIRRRWIRARYVAELHDIAAHYEQWEITGPPEIRSGIPVVMFSPWSKLPPRPAAHLPPVEEPPPDHGPTPDPPLVEQPPPIEDQLERFSSCCCSCVATSRIVRDVDDSRRWRGRRFCFDN